MLAYVYICVCVDMVFVTSPKPSRGSGPDMSSPSASLFRDRGLPSTNTFIGRYAIGAPANQNQGLRREEFRPAVCGLSILAYLWYYDIRTALRFASEFDASMHNRSTLISHKHLPWKKHRWNQNREQAYCATVYYCTTSSLLDYIGLNTDHSETFPIRSKPNETRKQKGNLCTKSYSLLP